MTSSLIYAPLVPAPVLLVLAGLCLLTLGLAGFRAMPGWPLRLGAALCLLAALANPSLQNELQKPLPDIVLVLADDSASNMLGERHAQTQAAIEALRSRIAAIGNTEMRLIRFAEETEAGSDDAGSLAMRSLARALAEAPRGRIAGAILISDGQVHDVAARPDLPAPLHLLLTGQDSDWDRRIVVTSAPAFAIVGEETRLNLKIEDQGAAPFGREDTVDLTIRLGDEPPLTFAVPLNFDFELPIRLPHGGQNVLQFSVDPAPGELSDLNNSASLAINGVRDRLRVLLVSGEPHNGERTWRNLLKSDASVDLVHFTILRPPEKQDDTPVEELALIAFPTRELFVEKIGDFDLIIFDRYSMQGILPLSYLDNVVSYVKEGGTVLVAAGPEFGTIDSLWRTPLAQILPVEPTARIISEGFRPALTELGRRHPVTEGLERLAPSGGWGRWFRLVEMRATGGEVVMSGPQDLPLLVLDRVGKGRVAVLASDQMWLWGRGFEGGGPQLELLRRLAHWMLKEPELEEERLSASLSGTEVTVLRRTMAKGAPEELSVERPGGQRQALPMRSLGPGRYEARFEAGEPGLYRLAQGDLRRVIAVGPPAPREFAQTIADGAAMAPAVAERGGAVWPLSSGMPDLRVVGEGRAAAGRGWIGITPRGAYQSLDIRVTAILPAWIGLLAAAVMMLSAWLIEGRGGPRPPTASGHRQT